MNGTPSVPILMNGCHSYYMKHMADQPYPIHEQLDRLIQEFKTFQQVSFPRGIPQPAQEWKPLLQSLTQYDASIAQATSHYLCGTEVNETKLPSSPALETQFGSVTNKSPAAQNFFNALTSYRNQIDALKAILIDCLHDLGNPCQQIKH